ncbi:hypothetical protein EXIGLDRAFT_835863 [Exidia glandulosa HHB12029]|uniref:F-box domain-containing protein n=1 Tax=Exidia glandulosa HHB12029 TaxID=1314781 RepID=A0A165ICS2_EXIGL|nr:hypothetical protein EXIGLDRAFT_835863 [Exidia glandulosa HHB12029]
MLSRISDDIVAEVVQWCSGDVLHSLACTSRTSYSSAVRHLWRSLNITRTDLNLEPLLDVLRKPIIANAVRAVKIYRSARLSPQMPIARVLLELPNLHDFTLECHNFLALLVRDADALSHFGRLRLTTLRLTQSWSEDVDMLLGHIDTIETLSIGVSNAVYPHDTPGLWGLLLRSQQTLKCLDISWDPLHRSLAFLPREATWPRLIDFGGPWDVSLIRPFPNIRRLRGVQPDTRIAAFLEATTAPIIDVLNVSPGHGDYTFSAVNKELIGLAMNLYEVTDYSDASHVNAMTLRTNSLISRTIRADTLSSFVVEIHSRAAIRFVTNVIASCTHLRYLGVAPLTKELSREFFDSLEQASVSLPLIYVGLDCLWPFDTIRARAARAIALAKQFPSVKFIELKTVDATSTDGFIELAHFRVQRDSEGLPTCRGEVFSPADALCIYDMLATNPARLLDIEMFR